MIKEISDVVRLIFKDHQDSHCVDCIDDIFIYFGDNINNDDIEYSEFIEGLYYIFNEYAPSIKEYYWQSIITVNFNQIPLDTLWEVFTLEQKKHK